MNPLFVPSLVDLGSKIIDRVLPDEAAKAQAQIELAKMQLDGDLQRLTVSMSAINQEAASPDPWTSRARPAFLYVFYVILGVMVIVAPLVGLKFPELMELYYINVTKGFHAIPEEVWWTFTTGYLGYGGLRTLEKVRRV